MEEINKIIGAAMKKWRKRHKISAGPIAADLNMNKSNFSNLEAGKRPITLETLINWSRIIGCPPEYSIQVYSAGLHEVKTLYKKPRN